MPRTIDHLVLAVHDFGAAADFYRRLGFQVGPRNVHPFGTENHIVQLDGSYLELIGLGRNFAPAAAPGAFFFAGFIADWLRHRQGLAMVALESTDAEADARSFKAAGFGPFAPLRFERLGQSPDGSDARLGFTLAFAASPLIEAAAFFTCQHRSPEFFWDEQLQVHPNAAQRIAGIMMVAENPASHAEFLGAWLGQRMMQATSMGVEMPIGEPRSGQTLEILTPLAARFRLGDSALGEEGAVRFVAYRLIVANLDRTRHVLVDAGIAFDDRGTALVLPPDEAFGVAVAFEAN